MDEDQLAHYLAHRDRFISAEPFSVHDACERGDITTLVKLLPEPEPPVMDESGQLVNPMNVNFGMDVNERDPDDLCPLHIAMLNLSFECCELLIRRGANLSSTTRGSSYLHLAVYMASFNKDKFPQNHVFAAKLVALLLSRPEINVNVIDDQKRTPLHLCALFGLVEIAEQLLSHATFTGAYTGDREGNNVLHNAAKRCQLQALLFFLKKVDANSGFTIDNQNSFKQTPLHIAASTNFQQGAKALIASGASLEATDLIGLTPMQTATKYGYVFFSDPSTTATSTDSKNNSNLHTQPTALIWHPLCSQHYTSTFPILRQDDVRPPNENVRRLSVLLHEQKGALRGWGVEDLDWIEADRAKMCDVLRTHEYNYIRRIKDVCDHLEALENSDEDSDAEMTDKNGDIKKVTIIGDDKIGHLDNDTSISAKTFEAAMFAAGAGTKAVDLIMNGSHRNVFCAVRPPGHHAGPTGVVTCKNDPHGSHGFCLINNIAVAAAYARCVYRTQIKKVAILDFDVHHGNGTEALVKNLQPNEIHFEVKNCSFMQGSFTTKQYKPWLDETDHRNVFFGSVHGYADPAQGDAFYPGSGKTNIRLLEKKKEPGAKKKRKKLCLNIGMQRRSAKLWRSVWRDTLVPRLVEFNPDMIFISAGFDAHKRDSINDRFIALEENDYTYVTDLLVEAANKCCNGRLVSMLEGGYEISGETISPFARSVAAHVRAMNVDHDSKFSAEERQAEKAAFEAIEVAKREAQYLAAAAAANTGDHTAMLPVEAEAGGRPRRSKRALPPVDWKKLNADLDAEQAARKKAKTDASKSAPES